MKISLDPNFREFIELLNSEKVRYLLLGGYAVNYYGVHRFTADIDFWIAVDPENDVRVSAALIQFGYTPEHVQPKQFLEVGRVHIIGRAPTRIDLLTGPSGLEFESCYARRIMAKLDGVDVSIISLVDLRATSEPAGETRICLT